MFPVWLSLTVLPNQSNQTWNRIHETWRQHASSLFSVCCQASKRTLFWSENMQPYCWGIEDLGSIIMRWEFAVDSFGNDIHELRLWNAKGIIKESSWYRHMISGSEPQSSYAAGACNLVSVCTFYPSTLHVLKFVSPIIADHLEF